MMHHIKKYTIPFLFIGIFFFSGCRKNKLNQKLVSITESSCKNLRPVGINPEVQSQDLVGNTSIPGIKKPKVVIFSSTGGAGHIIASQAMIEDLKDAYEVKVVNVLADVLGSLDQIRWLTFGRLNGEKLYNALLAGGWTRTTNFMVGHLAAGAMMARIKKIEALLLNYLSEEKPDILISVIPVINYPASNVATKLGIPFLVVTTDNDIFNWLYGVQKIKHHNFKITVGYDLPETKGRALLKNIPAQDVFVTGFPLKKAFYESKDLEAICKEWEIPQNKFVMMVSFGGAGSVTTFKYIKTLAKQGHNAHILACVGRNEQLARKLKKLKLRAPLTMSIIPFTFKIPDLMAVSNLIITKPGPGIINEALYSNLPMIIDHTASPLYWEYAGIDFVVHNGFGKTVRYFKNLNKTVTQFIEDASFYKGIKQKLQNYKKPNFGDFLRAKVRELYDSREVIKQDEFYKEYQLKLVQQQKEAEHKVHKHGLDRLNLK